MNTFSSDLNKILSAREQAHAVGGLSADVPVIKAGTIVKTDQKETDQKETEQKETDQKKQSRKKQIRKKVRYKLYGMGK